MSLGKQLCFTILSVLTFFLGACSSKGSSATNSIETVLQDLTLDPTGTTTVVEFSTTAGLSGATIANFEADGSQTPISVVVVVDTVTIQWDERVSPSDEVRAVGIAPVAETFHAVTTSDASAPAFTVTSAIQTPGLGGDTIDLQFTGPYVVAATAETLANWSLTVGSTALDLTGSSFVFDDSTQTLAVTLGTNANLHAAYCGA